MRLVEVRRRGTADDLDADRVEALLLGTPRSRGQQGGARAGAACLGRDEHLDHADVAEQQDAGVPDQFARLLGHPARALLLGHGDREVLAQLVDPPQRVLREVCRQDHVERP